MNTLDRLNSLSPDSAEMEFLKCCGSKNWAQRMVDQRPFIDVSELLNKADESWRSLSAQDWLEAFRRTAKLPALGKTVTNAYLLASPKSALKFAEDNTGLTIQLPGKSLDPIATVIVMESK